MLSPVNGFFGHIRKNHMRSLAMFAGFAVSMQIAFAALLTVPLSFSKNYEAVFSKPAQYFSDFGLLIFLLSLFLFLASYFFHTFMTRITTGFHYIEGYQDRRLENIVKNLAWTAGIPVPEIGIMEVPALNSFACGLTQDKATLVVTRGLMNELDDDELQAVIAHEIVHILNGDIGMMAAANASHGVIKLVNWLNPFQVRHGGLFESQGTGCLMFFLWPIMIPLIIVLALVGFAISLSSMVAGVTRYFVTSSREFIADAEAIRLTHNPAALISALRKIEGRSLVPHLDRMSNAMMIDGPADGQLASHPPMLERIQALLEYGGSMVHGAGVRKDTRGFGQRYQPTHFEGERAKTVYRRKTSKGVVARIQSDSETTIFGMPEGFMGTALAIGFGMMLVMSANTAMVSNALSGGKNSKLAANGVSPVIQRSPAFIAIDLTRNGLETRRVNQGVSYMDLDRDGRAERIGWVESGDGILFEDKNHNNRLDLPGELLMTDHQSAKSQRRITVLNRFDTTGNGRIDSEDAGYSRLRIWQDRGRNAIPNENEIHTLKERGVEFISLRPTHETYYESKSLASGAEIFRKLPYYLTPNDKVYRGKREALVFQVSFETDITQYKNEAGEKMRMSAEEYNERFGKPAQNSGELQPAFGNISDDLEMRVIGEEETVASAAPKDSERPALRGRRSD